MLRCGPKVMTGMNGRLSRERRISHALVFILLVLVAWLHLAKPFITVLFAYFALSMLHFTKRRWVAVVLFLIVVSGIFYGFVYFLKQAVVALPRIAETSIPSIIAYARSHGFELPFEDLESLKSLILDTVKDEMRYVGNFARFATKEFVFVMIGLVVAISLFLNPTIDLDRENHQVKNNLYSLYCDEIAARFRSFYRSFATVMGAQLIISTINTTLTAMFILAVSLPHAGVILGVTFLVGFLPIVGNLISNSIVVGVAFTRSPQLAMGGLVFLIGLHKLEYFLNSKIIGNRIKNPVWLTLLGLILGERLMGIPGMVLAPVILNYIKVEASQIQVRQDEKTPAQQVQGACVD